MAAASGSPQLVGSLKMNSPPCRGGRPMPVGLAGARRHGTRSERIRTNSRTINRLALSASWGPA